MLLLPTSLPPSKSCARSIGWSRFSAARIFAAVRSSMPLPNWAPRIESVKKIAIAFKESRRTWFRDLLLRLDVPDPEGLATQLTLLVDGSIAQDLVRDDPSMARAAKEAARVLIRNAGVELGHDHAVKTPRAAKRRGSDRGKG